MGGLRWHTGRRGDVEDRRFDPPAVPTIADGVDGGRMTDRQVLVDDLIRDEGIRLKVYDDSLGIATIGVGRNLSGKGISSTEAMILLNNDIDEAVTDLATSFPWFVELDPVRQRVVVNMRFNLGPVKFRIFKRMIAALAAGDYQKAAVSMRESLWARQVKGRAVRLIKQMQTGTP